MQIDIAVVQQQQLQIAVLMMIGFLAAKLRILTDELLDALVRFIMYIALPMMVMYRLPHGSSREILLAAMPLFLFVAFVYGFLALTGFAVGKLLGYSGNRLHVCITQMCTGNYLLIGFPVITSIFGDAAAPYMAIILPVDQIFLYMIDFPLTMPAENKWRPDSKMLKKIIHSSAAPAMLAMVIALAMIMVGIKIPEDSIIGSSFRSVMATCQPLSIIFLGGKIASLKIKKGAGILGGALTVLIRMLIMPVVFFALAQALGFPMLACQVAAMTAALPSVLATVMMTRINRTDCDYATVTVCMTTICYIFTLPMVGTLINLLIK